MDTKSEKPQKISSSSKRRAKQRAYARKLYARLKSIGMPQYIYRALPKEERKFIREGGIPEGYEWTPRDQELDGDHFHVYVLAHPAFPNACKVGHTVNLKSRLTHYNTACPDRLFKYAATFSHTEFDWVYTFYEQNQQVRLRGEWFFMEPTKAATQLREIWSSL